MSRPGRTVSAWIGHLVDLWRLFRFDICHPYSYSKFRQLRALGRRSGARMLIETGTFLGHTSMRCSRVFEKVITIELDPEIHRNARAYLSGRPNVECLEGDALALLPGVLARADVQDVIVFLDGHFSGGTTALGELSEPVCEEIDVLGRYREKIVAFVVDDFRLFGVEPGWPRKSELLRKVEEQFGATHDLTLHMDQLLVWRRKGHPSVGHPAAA